MQRADNSHGYLSNDHEINTHKYVSHWLQLNYIINILTIVTEGDVCVNCVIYSLVYDL